ncbi:50S ribosomal protein L18e [Candidatus Woesearchaeota archaeon]|nr:50S ribosomal protein L18e [Candidatus Woesearchaeota archaeon]
MRTGPTNPEMQQLIQELRKEASTAKAALWKRIADDLQKSTRSRRVVNLGRIARFTKENETVVVPGKVLGSGELGHKITVAALSFSESAKKQIDAKGSAITIQELLKKKVKPQDIKIIG